MIFGCIANEGYINRPNEVEEYCIFNRNQNACNYGVFMGSMAFLCCMALLALDIYFPQISSVKDRKKAVLADVGVSGVLNQGPFWLFAVKVQISSICKAAGSSLRVTEQLLFSSNLCTRRRCIAEIWQIQNKKKKKDAKTALLQPSHASQKPGVPCTSAPSSNTVPARFSPAFWSFMWFVGFCFLANQWQMSKPEDNPLREGGDAARAAITFCFFSIFTWVRVSLIQQQHM